MKALILNSGTGSRMGNIGTHKCLSRLDNGETILDAQIQALLRCGVNEIIVTTGAYAQELMDYAQGRDYKARLTFVHNPLFDKTNYIYSICLAREHVRGDILLLHGDLVFEQNVLMDVIAAKNSVMVVDSTKPLPDKDFIAAVSDGKITRIGVGITSDSGQNLYFAQPLYKLLEQDWHIWLDEIGGFCEAGKTGVYAEEAFGRISDATRLLPLDILGRVCLEVDNLSDLAFAQNMYAQMPEQQIYTGRDVKGLIDEILITTRCKKPFVVSTFHDKTRLFFERAVCFSDFTPPPTTEDVALGLSLFKHEGCDFIMSFGGGSAIDIAKAIKVEMPHVKHLTIPSTAGTGSEATRFAVVYENGNKLSLEDDSLLPNYVILNPDFLTSLPEYHKKSTFLDALCQGIESLWAKGCTLESSAYARSAIRLLTENMDEYIIGDEGAAKRILLGANLAGMAINITKTTAAHAMSYKLSAMFEIAHGHAVALCLPHCWVDCTLPISRKKFIETVEKLDMLHDFSFNVGEKDAIIEELTGSVNLQRLNNHPTRLTQDDMKKIYTKILEGTQNE